MNDIKKKFAVFHLLGWLLASLFFFWVFWGERPSNPLFLAAILLVVSVSVFYGHFFLLTRYWSKQSYSLYLTGLVLILLIGPFPFMWAFGIATESWYDFPVPYIPFLVLTLIFVMLSWIVRVIESWFINTLKRERLEKQAVQAELAYLKSQIDPHFLFNTLNNIHTLVYKQAATASEAVLRLSSLMRYMIYESNAHTVPLTREITYLQDYIGLQQLRYKKAPVVDLEIAGDTDACFIAPLLFINFLENAYKHSPARLEPGDIQVKVEVKDNTLIFSSQNPVENKQGNALDEPGGIGLPNIRKRLQLLYPDTHTLEISSADGRYAVILKIHDLHLQLHERKDHLLYH